MPKREDSRTAVPREEPPDDPREVWAAEVKGRVRKLLEQRGISGRELSRRIKQSPAAIALRLGERGVLGEWWTLYRIAEELKTSPDVLLGLTPAPAARGDAQSARRLQHAARLQAQSEKLQRLAAAEIDAALKASKE